ncbi:MAG: DUF4349 domain-containing protein [Bacteroidota bacterium]
MKKTIYILCLCTCFWNCGNEPNSMVGDMSPVYADAEYEMDAPETFEPPPAPPAPPQSQRKDNEAPKKESVPKEKKIIKDGNLQMEVENLEKAKISMDSTLRRFGAYYENEAYESHDYQSTYRLKIRVPANNFEKLINTASDQGGKVKSKNISARDVTEEFYDIKTRLENNESYLMQYRNLLKRANSIKDILEVQEKIRVLEEEMDSKKGRIKFINDRVNYSTLNLTLIEKHEWRKIDEKNFFAKAWSALKGGGELFMDFILFVLRLWPFVILIAGIVFLFKKWRRKKKNDQ